jgi:Tfp pilus assembly protein PilO
MNKTRQWAVFTLVAVLVVLAGGWMLLVSPQRSKAHDLQSQATSAQQRVSQLHAQLANLLAQKRNLPEQQRILAQISTKIPSDPAEPTLIREMQSAAHTAGVDLASLNPSTPVQVAAPAGAAPSTTTAGSTSGTTPTSTLPLYQVPLSITVTGSYFNVEMFEHSLEQLPRALLVSGLTVGPPTTGTTGSAGSTDGSTDAADVTATITAAVFLSPKDASATPSNPTATSASGSAAGSTAS